MRQIPVDFIVPIVFIDLACFALVLGATVWFFFVQSPQLMKFLGREKFVPIQMKITGWYFFYIQIPLFTIVMIAMVLQHNYNDKGIWMFATAIVGAVAGFINKTFIVPNALLAGAASVAERRGKDAEGSVSKFAVEGGGKGTKFWHQAVVAFVLLMTVGIVLHVWHLLHFLVANLPAILNTN